MEQGGEFKRKEERKGKDRNSRKEGKKELYVEFQMQIMIYCSL